MTKLKLVLCGCLVLLLSVGCAAQRYGGANDLERERMEQATVDAALQRRGVCASAEALTRTASPEVITTDPPIFSVEYKGTRCGKSVRLFLECSDGHRRRPCVGSASVETRTVPAPRSRRLPSSEI